ncbi:hypothetical protein Q3G72_022385 [Acer saccharum]|nr:hypothetical protein Q3G72_022385 [Acer saccharum]
MLQEGELREIGDKINTEVCLVGGLEGPNGKDLIKEAVVGQSLVRIDGSIAIGLSVVSSGVWALFVFLVAL